MFLGHRLDHDIREVLVDPEVAFQQFLHDLLILGDAARNEFQQVVIPAAQQVTFDHVLVVLDLVFEFHEILAAMVCQRHLGEHGHVLSQFLEVYHGTVVLEFLGLFF